MKLKHIEDYYDKIREKFPELSIKDLDKILKYGFRSYYIHNLYGGDVLNKSPYFTMYCGRFFDSNLAFYKYWLIKMKVKLRIKYKRSKTKYNGYYYFGLSDSAYEYYISQKKNKGRKKQKFHFQKLKLYKILEEVFIDKKYKHIFRIPYPIDSGFTIMKEDFIARDFEYIYKRNKDNQIKPVNHE